MAETGPPARVIDVTRLISRAGKGAGTGVDRVERAYIAEFLAGDAPAFGLVRSRLGFLLLDRAGLAEIARRIDDEIPWSAPDLVSRLLLRGREGRAAAETDARGFAIARSAPHRLGRMLWRRLPAGFVYFNVGLTNLSERTLAGVKEGGGRVVVLIHDTIPLDYPQFAAADVPRQFGERLRNASAHADIILCNSEATRTDVARHCASFGRVPALVVSHLGTDLPHPDPAEIPPGLDLTRPYFLSLGTIEPRKNLGLLLDVWEDFAADPPPGGVPQLFVIGHRGWASAELLARFDAPPEGVSELGALPDGAVAALMAGSSGLLFPSLVEGYGLPPIEAAGLGVPVLCGDLAIYRETLGDYPVYVDVNDRYLWRQAISAMAEHASGAEGAGTEAREPPRLPTWADHFKPVLRLT